MVGSVIDGTYKIHWVDNKTVPNEILESVVCNCRNGKRIKRCQCVLLQVPREDIRKCKGECHNEVPESFFMFDEDDIIYYIYIQMWR